MKTKSRIRILLTISVLLISSLQIVNATTVSSQIIPPSPNIMKKYLNIDRVNTVAVPIPDNTYTPTNCPTIGGAQGVQIGVLGEQAQYTYLNDSNLYSWSGNLWDGVSWTSCSSGCCINNCPYWIYDFTPLQIICAKVSSEWMVGP